MACLSIKKDKSLLWCKVALALTFSLSLSGCKEDVHDVEYYTKHQDEARSVLDKCNNGQLTDANCANAKDALARNKSVKSMFAH
ncbi:EexN family lipoprotein [Salmonella enterica]|nr:EexN family lipoprotein [Escherichia coli]EGZ8458158.1 EexN family lipoprotein [Salmonella enterica]